MTSDSTVQDTLFFGCLRLSGIHAMTNMFTAILIDQSISIDAIPPSVVQEGITTWAISHSLRGNLKKQQSITIHSSNYSSPFNWIHA